MMTIDIITQMRMVRTRAATFATPYARFAKHPDGPSGSRITTNREHGGPSERDSEVQSRRPMSADCCFRCCHAFERYGPDQNGGDLPCQEATWDSRAIEKTRQESLEKRPAGDAWSGARAHEPGSGRTP
jgi:hypothetical protein